MSRHFYNFDIILEIAQYFEMERPESSFSFISKGLFMTILLDFQKKACSQASYIHVRDTVNIS